MTANELLKERATLLARLEVINAALTSLETPARAIRIYTRRNLRNTYISAQIFEDRGLTVKQDVYAHEGWISAESAAFLRTEGQVDGDLIELSDPDA